VVEFKPETDWDALNQVREMVAASEKPLILAGAGYYGLMQL
jgi:hypothetical protein